MAVCNPVACVEWELMSDTTDEKEKFVEDAKKLTAVVVSETGAMSHVADLLNIWGVFVPSKHVSKMVMVMIIELMIVWYRNV
jgi:cytochrome c biogenesis protein ResB